MLRSVLFVPAANKKAMAKAPSLAVDAIIIDLEDALADGQKEQGRAAAIRFLRQERGSKTLIAVRVNAHPSELCLADIRAIVSEEPSAIVVPKVQNVEQVRNIWESINLALPDNSKPRPQIWAMIETPLGVLNLSQIAQNAKAVNLTCFIAGTNDLAKELKLKDTAARESLLTHLTQIVLCGRAYGLQVLDGVYNKFSDLPGFTKQAKQGRALGFDGKTLIHPDQIAAANTAFAPDAAQIKRAKSIISAYSLKKNAGKGAVELDGQMIERLHLSAALDLIAKLDAKKTKT